MSGNNPYGPQGQPNQPGPGQPGRGQPGQGQPNQPGPGQPNQGQPGPYGGPTYSGPQYGQPQQPYSPPTPSGPYPPQYGQPVPGPQGPQGPQGPAGPQQPYGMYPGQPPQPQKKSNKLPIIIGAAVLALVLIGTIIAVAVVRGADKPTAGGSTNGGGTASSEPPQASKPSDAVQGYLQALAAGDAQTAISYAVTAPADTTFLTNEVLAASNKIAPITDINVPEVNDEYAYQVDATYKMGSQAVNAQIGVEKDGDAWKVRDVAYDLDLGSTWNKTVPMLANGVAVESNTVSLFPGSYELTTGNKNIDYGKSNVLVIESPSDYPRGLSDIRPALTKAGEKAFTKAVDASVKKCMKSKKLKNANCPNNVGKVSGGVTPKDGTFKWTYDKDDLDNMKVTLDYANPAIAESSVSLSMKATGQCKQGPCYITPWSTPDPSANMIAEQTKIIWK